MNLTGSDSNKPSGYTALPSLHCGEACAAYAICDGCASLRDRRIAGPALEYYDLLIRRHVKPGALILDAGAGTGERTRALLQNSRPGAIVGLDTLAGNVVHCQVQDY